PKAFDTAFDPSALYAAFQCLMVTHNGGQTWAAFSPDLTTRKGQPTVPCGTPWTPPKSKKKAPPSNPFFGPQGPVINSFSISKVQPGVFWTVSSNGQIYTTTDGGKTWNNVSNITGAPAHTSFQQIEAGDQPGTAYVIGRAGAQRSFFAPPSKSKEDTDVPLIWRTTDGGQTWTSIINGLPRDQRTGSWVNVLRADPKQPGLLFAGTETTVFVSFDNGDHWQSLRQNLPSTSIRDLVVHTGYHQNDLVICTYGRGFWVLDDITPLRQIAADAQAIAASPAYLFKPQVAIRARINSNWDQPFSVEVPHAANPPYGVIVDYYLQNQPTGPIQLQVFDAHGNLVWSRSSIPPAPIEGQAYPRYWLASPQSRALTTHVGENRVNWNLHYNAPPAFQHDLENQMNMVAGTVTPGPHGPQVIPGVYTLKLTVDGKVYTSHATVINDPRVGQSPDVMAVLRAQNRLNLLAYHAMQQTYAGWQAIQGLKTQLAAVLQGKPPADVAAKAKQLDASLSKLGGVKPSGGILAYFLSRRRQKPGALRSFITLNNNFNTLVSMMQVGMDMPPTPARVATWESDCRQYNRTVAAWKAMESDQVAAFNAQLEQDQLPQLKTEPVPLTAPSCTFLAAN
ncbi:MAG: WD40/YVTN/BNR-like repeat-containing protein, partial [Terriglobales bacterium]